MPSDFGIIPYRALAKEERKAFNGRKGYKILAITVPCAEKECIKCKGGLLVNLTWEQMFWIVTMAQTFAAL